MANFNFYLNRQGVRGKQGEKGDQGEKGFSPYIEIKTNTPTEFVLTVNNEDNSFDTPNLIPTAIGDKVTEMEATLNTHTEDIANLKLEDQRINSTISGIQNSLGVVDAEIEAVNQRIDNQSYKITDLETEVNNLSGEVASNSADITSIKNINTTQDSDISALKTKSETTDTSIENLNNEYSTLNTSVTKNTKDISSLKTELKDTNNKIYTIEDELSYMNAHINDLSSEKQNKLIEGANITLIDNTDGTTTISSTGGGSGSSELDSYIEGSTTENVTTISAKNGKALELSAPTIAVGDNLVNEINGENTQLYLKQGDIAEGTNITVEKTATGVKISSIGSTTNVPIATTETTGKVKPDGTTITITEDGTISAVNTIPTNMVTTDTKQSITGTKTFALEGLSSSALMIGEAPNGRQYGLIFRSINTTKNFSITNNGYSNSSLAICDFEKEITLAARRGFGTLRIGGDADSLTFIKKDGTVVDLLAGGAGDVTKAGDNAFTGSNSFSKGTKFLAESDTLIFDDSTNGQTFPTGANITKGKDLISRERNYDTVYYDTNGTETYSVYRNDLTISSSGDIVLAANNNQITGTVLSSNGFGQIKDKNGNIILSQGNVTAGDNVTIENTDSGIKISATRSPSNMVTTDTSDEYGIRADYAVRHGIIDNPNGIISYSATNKDITVNQGLVLNCAGNGSAKTTIAAAMPYTVTSTGAFTLFYADGNLLECGKVDYSTVEPEDNGIDNYQAWFNPDKTANPNQQWQFKSNDTGNVFRHVNSATPLADFVAGETGITSVSYLGYRVTDDDVFVRKQDVSSLASPDISRKVVLDNTVATGTPFSAPTDGIFTAQVTNASRETFVSLRNGKDSLGNNSYAPAHYHPTMSVSAKKGDSVILTYGAGATLEFIIFTPLFGAE